jgi:hypothetical protein
LKLPSSLEWKLKYTEIKSERDAAQVRADKQPTR